MLSKEECIKRLKEARSTIQPYYYINEAIDYAIKELQNPPLKFEELHEGMWIWDNKYKQYIKIRRLKNKHSFIGYYPNFEINPETDEPYENLQGIFFFEKNRFYRREVNNDE